MLIKHPTPVRLITHNIRYDKEAPWFPGEQPWTDRNPRILAQFQFNTRRTPGTFLCLQEALQNQVEDIHAGLNRGSFTFPAWEYIGIGRNGAGKGGEYNPIFYQPAVWQLRAWWTRWLSETPKEPGSKWPGTDLPRIVTIGRFRHRGLASEVLVMCTHLDHMDPVARAGQAKLLVELARQFSLANEECGPALSSLELPVALAGDFNSESDEDAYNEVTQHSPFVDVWLNVPPAGYRHGNQDTFTDFVPTARPKRIDFIFLRMEDSETERSRRNGRWEIEGAAVLSNVFQDGVYLSDHRAVVVDALLHS